MSNNVLGSILVELRANTVNFVGELGKAAQVAQTQARKISSEFSSLQKIASQTFGAFGNFNPVISQFSFVLSQTGRAAAGAMKEFGKFGGAIGPIAALASGGVTALASIGAAALGVAAHTSESAAKLYQLSQQTGVSVEALSGLGYVARQVGVDQETLARSLEKMSRSAYQSATGVASTNNIYALAYRTLGVAVKDANGNFKSTEQLFTDLAAKFATMPDGIQKTALQLQIFGKGGAQIATALNLGSSAIDRMIGEAQRFGVIISTDAARGAEQFEQGLGRLKAEGEGLALRLTNDLLPALTFVVSAIEKDLAKGGDSALRMMIDDVAVLSKQVLAAGADFVFLGRVAKGFFDSSKLTKSLVTGQQPTWTRETPDQKKTREAQGDSWDIAWKQHQDFIKGLSSLSVSPSEIVPPPKVGGWDAVSAAHEKLEDSIQKVIAGLKIEVATFGQGTFALEDAKRAEEGWTAAQRESARQLESKLGLLQATANWYKQNAEAQRAAERSRNVTSAFAGLAPTLAPTSAGGPALLGGVSSTLDSGPAGVVDDLTKKYKDLIATIGQTDLDKDIQRLRDLGVPEQTIASVEDLGKQYEQLSGKIETAWEHEKKIREEWDQIQLESGNFQDKIAAVFDQIALKGIDTGKQIASAFTAAFDGITDDFAKALTFPIGPQLAPQYRRTGRAHLYPSIGNELEQGLGKTFEGLSQSLIKSQLTKYLSSGVGALANLIPGLKGHLPSFKKADGSSSSPFYVIVANAGASGDIAGGKLPIGGFPGAGPSLGQFASDLGGFTAEGQNGKKSGGILGGILGGAGGVFGSILKHLASSKSPDDPTAGKLPIGGYGGADPSLLDPSAALAAGGKSGDGGSGLLGGILGGAGSLLGSILKFLPHFESGGSISGPSIVGEAGAELFVPNAPGRIVPNKDLGGSGDVHNHYNIDARGSSITEEQFRRSLQAVHADAVKQAVRVNNEQWKRNAGGFHG